MILHEVEMSKMFVLQDRIFTFCFSIIENVKNRPLWSLHRFLLYIHNPSQLYQKMYHEDFLQSLGIILTSTPASMDAYKMFTDLNQSSKSTRAVAKSSFQDKTWTKEYFQGAHAFKDMIGIVGITAETLDE